MSMKVLVYRKCSTCMKALKWLDEHNINYEERAIKEENPTYEVVLCQEKVQIKYNQFSLFM